MQVKRIIPSLLLCNGRLVKGSEFINHIDAGNPVTTLSYHLPQDSYVVLSIYDMKGSLVKNLVNEIRTAGMQSIQWNATNNIGRTISAGVYLYSIETGEFRQTKKMILLK